ncbi:hypothetical protein HBH70_225220 [Parastagonospora nodorum]|nr:hypothetical protein HBH51_224690 [Parastagonospora nodorum]KAH3964419.1 hypothetical protein HBH52_212030 [Parastagonospora nodorum]KAH4094475.1 hypothetical protein HBH46_173630 [Parastagonospora nodorum]KAH4157065.1 hypothetical protein HBH43_202340 [Parastagonospora nodorum]KAH5078056.1 hypothetical protein HBI73_173450 [Parastagonospora nodorum]
MSNAELCSRCQSLITGTFPKSVRHHGSKSDVQVAAENGCFICAGFLNGIATLATAVSSECDILVYAEEEFEDGWRLAVSLSESEYKGYQAPSYAAFDFISLKNLDASNSGAMLDPCIRVSSLQRWMNQCLQSHTACQRDSTVYWPTRIINVGTVAEHDCRLCVTEQEEMHGPYATLSHCWGNSVLTKLLLNNFDNMVDSIDEENLPLTFREAVTTIRQLGIRYVWIDSLCIIQDSAEDWQIESASMTQVYRNAICCLAATGAHDSSQGLYLARDAPKVPHQITTSWTDKSNTICLAVPLSSSQIILRDVQGPLTKRAWCYQELRLSRRIIHFTKEQIFWECCENRACESMPLGTPKYDRDRNATRHYLRRDMLDQHGTISSVRGITPHEFWLTTVEEYSKGKLSYASDRLVAVSGLARLLQKSIGSGYVAGMWRKNLELQLLWTVWEMGETRPKNKPENRRPSWSWAPLNSRICYATFRHPKRFPDFRSLARILNVTVQSVTNDTYGEAQSGIVTMHGRIYNVRGNFFAGEARHCERRLTLWNSWELEFLVSSGRFYWDTQRDKANFDAGHTIYWIPIWARHSYLVLEALLLYKLDGSEQDYRRVGKFFLYDALGQPAEHKAYSRFWDEFLSCPEETIRIH